MFPLQTLGFDVDILNTVQFSNHTGMEIVVKLAAGVEWILNSFYFQPKQDILLGQEIE